MSLSKNQNFEFWKAVEAKLRSLVLTCCGDTLVDGDRTTVSQVLILWALVIQDLCGATRLRSNKRLANWLLQLASFSIDSIVDTLKYISSTIRDINRDMGTICTWADFKHQLRGVEGFVPAVAEPFSDLLELFLHEPSPALLHCLLTGLEFPCRMTIEKLPSLLHREMQKYRDLESEMKVWRYPAGTLAELRSIVQLGLSDLCDHDFRPKHGSGVTSEKIGRDSDSKYSLLLQTGPTARLRHLFCQEGISHPLLHDKMVTDRVACRVLFVPKGANSKRVISAEPTVNQWVQQSLLRHLADFLPRSIFRVTMDDQTRNQKLAYEGSWSRNYATIDLSSASDTVTYQLVQALFEGHWIWKWLWSCRTRFATLENEWITLEKFSPMGSAVCFPIESIVFSAIVLLAMQRKGVHHNFVVYGDDIICHSSVYDEVLEILKEMHFSVNEKKSFFPESPFKESCGKEYYYGNDVTPFRIPRFFQGMERAQDLKGNPRLLDSWVSLANGLFQAGLMLARSYLVHRLLSICPNVLFTEKWKTPGVLTYEATNYHLRERYESENSMFSVSLRKTRVNYCRGRVLQALHVQTVQSPGSDDIRYQMMLEQMKYSTRESLERPDQRIDLAVGPTRVVLRNVWVPDSDVRDRLEWSDGMKHAPVEFFEW